METASTTSGGFITATSSCGCTPDNAGGQPVGLSVSQNFGSIEFAWTVGSACEGSVSISRALVDPIDGQAGNPTAVAQLSIGLPCGSVYRPSKTEVDEDIVRDSLLVSAWAEHPSGARALGL